MSDKNGHLEAEKFREQGHQIIDWVADYLDGGNRRYPVLSQVSPGAVADRLPDFIPEHGEDLDLLWRDFQEVVLPGITHWNHPGFMAYFGITGSGPGILGELVSAALNVNGMLWRTSPSATELELVTLQWLRRGLDLPDDFFGFLTDTASISSLLALATAREAAGLDIRQRGMAGRHDIPPAAGLCLRPDPLLHRQGMPRPRVWPRGISGHFTRPGLPNGRGSAAPRH